MEIIEILKISHMKYLYTNRIFNHYVQSSNDSNWSCVKSLVIKSSKWLREGIVPNTRNHPTTMLF